MKHRIHNVLHDAKRVWLKEMGTWQDAKQGAKEGWQQSPWAYFAPAIVFWRGLVFVFKAINRENRLLNIQYHRSLKTRKKL